MMSVRGELGRHCPGDVGPRLGECDEPDEDESDTCVSLRVGENREGLGDPANGHEGRSLEERADHEEHTSADKVLREEPDRGEDDEESTDDDEDEVDLGETDLEEEDDLWQSMSISNRDFPCVRGREADCPTVCHTHEILRHEADSLSLLQALDTEDDERALEVGTAEAV
jgi:hypothetical protein